jgi:hypothetical protein
MNKIYLKNTISFIIAILILSFVGLYFKNYIGQPGVDFVRSMIEWLAICFCAVEILYKVIIKKNEKPIGIGFKYILLYVII